MNRTEFLEELHRRLLHLPEAERTKSLEYFDEMIGDRMEDGMSETQAVAALGSMDEIVSGILQDMPFPALLAVQVKSSRDRAKNKTLWKVLAIAGAPLWVPLLLALAVLVLALYIVLFAALISMFALLFAFACAGIFGLISGLITAAMQSLPVGVCICGMALVCGGLALLLFRPILAAARGCIELCKWMLHKFKGIFVRRPAMEVVQP